MPDGTAFWLDQHAPLALPALAEDLEVDIAIVGAGIVGLHCAINLRDSGLKVAVFEAREIGGQATGKSTAKVTVQHGLRYRRLIRNFGDESARLYAEANRRALDAICGLCAEIAGGAALERRDAVIYARDAQEAGTLEAEAQAAMSLGLPASFETAAQLPFPFPVESVLRFPDQAQFDPVAYLQGLASMLWPDVRVFEQSRVTAVEKGDTMRLAVNGHRVTARHVVVATQIPVVAEGMFFAKAYPFAHPLAAAPLNDGVEFGGMFKNMGDPSLSFRTARREGRTYLIAAGKEFKPGDPDAQAEAVENLLGVMKDHFGIEEPTHLWINEDFRPMDGAAFVGQATSSQRNLLVATGFDAWGITQGAVAGEILAAAVLGQAHPAAALHDATRVKPVSGGATFVKENVAAGVDLLSGRLSRAGAEIEDIAPGQGGVVTQGGEKLAVRRHVDGRLTVLSAKCSHLGCIVGWNGVDRTWDCPCHGSRFDEEGNVLAGPATAPLAPRDASEGKSNA